MAVAVAASAGGGFVRLWRAVILLDGVARLGVLDTGIVTVHDYFRSLKTAGGILRDVAEGALDLVTLLADSVFPAPPVTGRGISADSDLREQPTGEVESESCRVLRGPISFAHRGGRHLAPDGGEIPENSLEAFQAAVDSGARGIEADAWVTADGVCVLNHDPFVWDGPVPMPIWELPASRLPPHVPSLEQFYERFGGEVYLSLDCRSKEAGVIAIETARAAGGEAPSRLWLCSFLYSHLREWRRRSEEVILVDSSPVWWPPRLVESRSRRSASEGIDAFNLYHAGWTPPLVDTVHRLGMTALAWGVNDIHKAEGFKAMGIDGIYSDWLEIVVSFRDDHAPVEAADSLGR